MLIFHSRINIKMKPLLRILAVIAFSSLLLASIKAEFDDDDDDADGVVEVEPDPSEALPVEKVFLVYNSL